MTEPSSPGRIAYMPALDGLRGVFVVLGPLLYHARPESVRGGPDILPGGILSLDLFFVLSSFLIVSIALREWDNTGRIDLVAYAGRRARRLLPALFTALAAVTAYLVWAGDPDIVPRWTGAVVSALTYSANWHEIAAGVSYFDQFDNPSPLKHVWSFAIEEQFYVFAPLFVVVGMTLLARRRWVLLAAAVVAALASAAWMAHLHTPGADPSRVYYGTDTRAQALFTGIALAVAARIAGPPRTRAGRRVLRAAVYPAMALCLWMITSVSERDEWMFERGGFLLMASASAVIIYGMAQPAGRDPLQRLFELSPVRYWGRLSYGLYLYHWPIYLLVTGERAGALFGRARIEGYALLAVHLILTFAAAAASYHLIERPVMQRRWPAVRRPITLAAGGFAGAAAVAVILAGLLAANSSRPVRIEQVFVPVAAAADEAADSAAGPDSAAAGGSASGDGVVAADGHDPEDKAPPEARSGPAPSNSSPGDAGSGDKAPSNSSPADAGSGDKAASNSTPAVPGSAEPGSGAAPAADTAGAVGGDAPVVAPVGGDAPAGPLRVLVVGDSVSAQIGWALQRWSTENPGEMVVYNESHLGCGVVRHGLKLVPGDVGGPVGEVCSNWAVPVSFEEVADAEVVSWPTALEVFAPDAVLAHVSPWDATDRIVPGVAEDWTSIGDPVYDAYVLSEYTAATELLTGTGATLYWLEGPVLNRELVADDHAARIAGLNRLAAEAAASQAAAGRSVVMTDFPSFIGEIGSDGERARRDDGVHLSEQGLDEVAPWLAGILTAGRRGR